MPDGFDTQRLFDANCLRLSCGHPWSAHIEKGIETLGALTAQMLAGG
jgi:DNA-binding transcriptional MocR family regulator